MKQLIIIQTTAPDYRKNFFSHLADKLGDDNFKLFSGQNFFEPTVRTDPTIPNLILINNIFLFKRKLLFQTGSHWNFILKNNVVVLEMNPRNLSNWVFLIIRKITKRKTILWGHAWPRKGSEHQTEVLRNLMRKLPSKLIVYTEQQKQELLEKRSYKIIIPAPNSLYFEYQFTASNNESKIKDIIYVGRLTRSKKVYLLVNTFIKMLQKLPSTTNLIIVGEGPEKERIKNIINERQLEKRIQLEGHISNYEQLKELYDKSLVSVSPGYVGLSITQSFSFGVPMLISKTENHSPEIEASKENFNSVFFDSNKGDDFAKKLEAFFKNKEKWIEKRTLIVNHCRASYSVEKMAKPFLELVS